MERTYELLDFYNEAKRTLVARGYGKEILYVENIPPFPCPVDLFLHQYIFVVISSGMKNQVAESIMRKMAEKGYYDFEIVGHPGKRAAIGRALKEHRDWYKALAKAPDKLAYLESLPWIGPITKYHLARNIGFDVAKPDRHLVRLAEAFGYGSTNEDVQRMCRYLSNETLDRIGVVDVVLWRYCNLFSDAMKEIAKLLKEAPEKSWDEIKIVTGPRGVGMSQGTIRINNE